MVLGKKKSLAQLVPALTSTSNTGNGSVSSSSTSGSSSSSSAPLGIRNNNPLNIRVSGNNWLGKIPSENAFEKFESMKYGIRAAVKNLQTYYNNYGLKTVKDIISRWAPSNENDTNTYIRVVCSYMGIEPDTEIFYDGTQFADLVSAMSVVENGQKYKIDASEVYSVIKEFKLF